MNLTATQKALAPFLDLPEGTPIRVVHRGAKEEVTHKEPFAFLRVNKKSISCQDKTGSKWNFDPRSTELEIAGTGGTQMLWRKSKSGGSPRLPTTPQTCSTQPSPK